MADPLTLTSIQSDSFTVANHLDREGNCREGAEERRKMGSTPVHLMGGWKANGGTDDTVSGDDARTDGRPRTSDKTTPLNDINGKEALRSGKVITTQYSLPSPCLSVRLSASISLWLSLCLCLSLSYSCPMSVDLSLCPCPSVYPYVCDSVSLSLCVCLSLSHCLSVSLRCISQQQ